MEEVTTPFPGWLSQGLVTSSTTKLIFLPSLALIISCVATLLLQKWIGFPFLANGRWGRMAADELVVVVECHQLVGDAVE